MGGVNQKALEGILCSPVGTRVVLYVLLDYALFKYHPPPNICQNKLIFLYTLTHYVILLLSTYTMVPKSYVHLKIFKKAIEATNKITF